MKPLWIICLLTPLFWNCKQTPKATPTVPPQEEQQVEATIPKGLKEIARFSDTPITETEEINAQFRFLGISTNGQLEEVSIEQAMDAYKSLIGSGMSQIHPIFEVKDSEQVVVVVSGKGYGGNIWGKLLVNRENWEIVKLVFDHKAESEGYGAGITLTSFENQFKGSKIDWKENTFGLRQDGNTMVEGMALIDGVSGATVSSRAVVDMVNEGLIRYAPYFERPPAE